MKKPYAVRYRCVVCGADKFVEERPANPKPRIRTGCDSERCGQTLTTHRPVGRGSVHLPPL